MFPIVPNLNKENNLGDNIANPNITDPVFCAIQKYEKHPSILKETIYRLK